MSYPITDMMIPGLPRNPYRKGVSAYEGVVAHSTANTATAVNERNYEANGHWKEAFVHFFVDWTSIIRVADINYLAWGAGHEANQRYVQIELCETPDPEKFKESYNRYVWLLAKVLKDKNLGVTDGETLVSHAWVSKNLGDTNHQDPISYLASHGVTWEQHVKNVQCAYNGSIPYKVVVPNTAFWQARNLVTEFQQRGFKCWGSNLKLYGPGQTPADPDPYQFILETDLETAKALVIELQTRGYDRTYGEALS